MRKPGVMPRVVFASTIAGLLGVAAWMGETAAQPPPEPVDYYFADGQRVKLNILRDRIGVLALAGVRADAVNEFLTADNAGVRIEGPMPGNILVLRVDNPRPPAELEKMARGLTARNAARDADKVIQRAGLLVTTEGSESPRLVTDEFIAEFQDDVTPGEIAEMNAQNKVEIVQKNPFRKNQYVLRSTAESNLGFLGAPARYYETRRLKISHPRFFGPKVIRQSVPNDTLFGDQWHHQNTGQGGGTVDADIDTPLAWDITRGNPNLVIAVLDNGFDVSHPDLIPNLFINPGEIAGDNIDNDGNGLIDDINGWDFTDNNGVLTGGSHGTSVAGCVGARGGNMLGVTGTAQRCRLLLVRIPMNAGDDFIDGMAFDYARVMGASVITNSWGYPVGVATTPTVIQAINDAATLGRGGLGAVVFFAMNNPNVNDCGANPDISSLASVIAVSRATNRDRFDNSGFGNCMDVLGPTRGQPGFGTLGITTTAPGGGFTSNFSGTSAATPITAGIAALMLDVSPGLNRTQVQNVIQDTADRIEDSLGVYRTVNGFSAPASGNATHGNGRVNAFEAVRLVAPRDRRGRRGRGGVDIMLRDNRLDWGNTEQLSNVTFEPIRGFIPHWQSVDIKVDAPPYQAPPMDSLAFDALVDEDPRATQKNKVYVRVRNRGPNSAATVTVKLHWAFAGTALPPLPPDFWTAFPADSAMTSIWHPMSAVILDKIAYSGPSVAGRAGLDAARIASFDFDAPPLDPTQPAFQHYCVLGVIDAPQDPVSGIAKGSLVPDFITPRDNNVTHRNLVLQPPTRDGRSIVRFFARNPSKKAISSRLEVSSPKGWKTVLEKGEIGKPFELRAGEERLMTLILSPSQPRTGGEAVISQFDLSGEKPVVTGGLTIRLDSKAPRETTVSDQTK